jgi:hypothetical protein
MRRDRQVHTTRLQSSRDKIYDFDAKESGENDEGSTGVEHSVAAGVAAKGWGKGGEGRRRGGGGGGGGGFCKGPLREGVRQGA